MSHQIIVRYPNGQVLTFPFDKEEIYCGRSDENQIRLAHSFVSSRHIRLERQGNAFQVRDLGSTNGTLLNGEPLEANIPQPLRTGDTIQVGSLEILLEPVADATIIEKLPKPLPPAEPVATRTRSGRIPASAPLTGEPSPMWQLQTGMIRQHPSKVTIDDQSVSIPRRELPSSVQRPGFEERIRRAVPPDLPPAGQSVIPVGTLSQAVGVALILAALAALLVVLLL